MDKNHPSKKGVDPVPQEPKHSYALRNLAAAAKRISDAEKVQQQQRLMPPPKMTIKSSQSKASTKPAALKPGIVFSGSASSQQFGKVVQTPNAAPSSSTGPMKPPTLPPDHVILAEDLQAYVATTNNLVHRINQLTVHMAHSSEKLTAARKANQDLVQAYHTEDISDMTDIRAASQRVKWLAQQQKLESALSHLLTFQLNVIGARSVLSDLLFQQNGIIAEEVAAVEWKMRDPSDEMGIQQGQQSKDVKEEKQAKPDAGKDKGKGNAVAAEEPMIFEMDM